MKRKIISLILVLMLLPLASLFSACGKDKGYNLNKLENDFYKIANENENVKIEDNRFVLDYSAHTNVNIIINAVEPYTSLSDYNYVFNNLMTFSFAYIEECSQNSPTANAKIRNKIKYNLRELKKSVSDVNDCFDIFAEMLNISQADPTADACLSRYKNLIDTYEDMYTSAINFSNSLSNYYYDHILKDGNPKVYSINLDKFNPNPIVAKLESRINYQITNLTESFVEMYISEDLTDKIIDGSTTFDLDRFGYYDSIQALLEKPITSVEVANEKANHANNKQNFYDFALQAQTIQETLNNDNKKFIEACNRINYAEVKANPTATAEEETCVGIIESNYSLIQTYNQVLMGMLNIVTN